MPPAYMAYYPQCFVMYRKSESLPGLENFAIWLMSQLDSRNRQMAVLENNLKAERKKNIHGKSRV